tara:strand:- start:386 stop:721 length:336 start_codon:yes stop_codon:yes gene_type:complete
MYKTWFQRQKANSPYKGNADLIAGAGKLGASKSLMSGVQDTSIEKASENMQPNTGSVPNNNNTDNGENTIQLQIEELNKKLNDPNTTDEEKLDIQKQINELTAQLAEKEGA